MAGKVKSKIMTSAYNYFLGTCVASSKKNAAKVRIPYWELNEHNLDYFQNYKVIYADDPKKLCKTGDVVLVKHLSQQLSRLITHQVIEVIYPLGDVTDPITGKKVVMSQYREYMDEDVELFGKKPSTFDYSKAPRRGRLENTRDFSNKKMFVKYYEDNPDNPLKPDTA